MYVDKQTKTDTTDAPEAQCEALESQAPYHSRETVQCRFSPGYVAETTSKNEPIAIRPNQTGIPDKLKSGLENLSGYDLSPVRVHYNSPKPQQLGALAYTQGTNIHIGPGQERHLPHEGWHVVQQMQGRVKPTLQAKGLRINDQKGLEHEADVMGDKVAGYGSPLTQALSPGEQIDSNHQAHSNTNSYTGSLLSPPLRSETPRQLKKAATTNQDVIQRRMGVEAELTVPVTRYNAVHFATDAGKVRAFLGLGVSYNQQCQGPVNGYHIDTDKDEIAGKIKGARIQINDKLKAAGHADREIASNNLPASNMEFVSDPFDEETLVGRTALQTTVGHMATDMDQKVLNGRAGMTRLGNYCYGIPTAAQFTAFANAEGNEITNGLMQGARDDILGSISDHLYVQVTAGVLPARISKFLTAARQDQESLGQLDVIGEGARWSVLALARVKELLTSRSADVAHAAVNTFKEEKWSPIRSVKDDARLMQSLEGYLSLLTSYAFSYMLVIKHVGTVGKNMVPFLAKMQLHQAQDALDVRVRPMLWTQKKRKRIRNLIFNSIDQELYTQGGLFTRRAIIGALQGVDINKAYKKYAKNDWMPNVLAGTSDDFSREQLEACTTIAPEVHALSKAIRKPKLGGGTEAGQEKLIALEYRMIPEAADTTPNNLWTFVESIMNKIRAANAD